MYSHSRNSLLASQVISFPSSQTTVEWVNFSYKILLTIGLLFYAVLSYGFAYTQLGSPLTAASSWVIGQTAPSQALFFCLVICFQPTDSLTLRNMGQFLPYMSQSDCIAKPSYFTYLTLQTQNTVHNFNLETFHLWVSKFYFETLRLKN